jgi:hypothetical protein
MLSYGDSASREYLPSVVRDLRSEVQTLRGDLTGARDFLIRCGQLEQGVGDSPFSDLEPACRNITDLAADVFLAAFGRESLEYSATTVERSDHIVALSRALNELSPPRYKANLKIPEGFAFYHLFPEQYAVAANAWCNGESFEAPVLVIGIRSIGTTLSAVVAATLHRRQIPARRITVRPIGHPFQRHVTLEASDLSGIKNVWIVDEGPGASGSSMAAVADACLRHGFPPGSIVLFPGHDGMPGSFASERVREIWKAVARSPACPAPIRWREGDLVESLTAESARIFGKTRRVLEIREISAGAWRKAVFPNEGSWPAVFPALERKKFLILDSKGEGLLWKFAGLGPGAVPGTPALQAARRELERRAAKGWSPAPRGECLGFLAMDWIRGRAARISDANPEMIRRLADYICFTTREPSKAFNAVEAFERLRGMLLQNAAEALGPDFPVGARSWIETLRPADDLPLFGDGRIGPEEWIWPDSGGLPLKADSLHFLGDHSLVGDQPFPWDVAGAVVEWELEAARVAAMTDRLASLGMGFPAPLLAFYVAAYEALSLARSEFAENATTGAEKDRHQKKKSALRSRLRNTLLRIGSQKFR